MYIILRTLIFEMKQIDISAKSQYADYEVT